MKQKIHSFIMMIFSFTILPVFLLFIYDCGPNSRQIAYAGTNLTAFEKKIADEKAMLKEQAMQKIKAGQVFLPQVEDPGYPVADCILPDNFPADMGFVSFDTGFIGKIQYVCCNKEAGRSIIAWRTRYCEGSNNREACILGKWINGEPAFEGELIGTHETCFGNITFIFKRCNIK